MVVFELIHIFFRHEGEMVYNPKKLGLFYSHESVQKAIQYYITQPGFHENQDAFSVAERSVIGKIIDDTVFEAIIYLHSEDYEFETEIGLGFYGNEIAAQRKLTKYCRDNAPLVNAKKLLSERIVNKCVIERKEWLDGFSILE